MTAPNASTDPFSMLEDALWHAVESHPAIVAIVQPANRVKFTTTTQEPVQDSLASSDLPVLQMQAEDGDINRAGEGSSSSSVAISQRYSFWLKTDDNRTNFQGRGINPVKWALFQALMRLRYGPTTTLPFVNMVNAIGYRDARNEDFGTQDQKIPGWSCLLRIEVRMVFGKAQVIA